MRKLLKSGLAVSRGPIARSSIQSIVIRLAGMAISFVHAVLCARLLGAGGYGIAAVALSTAQIIATVAAFGFGLLAVRDLARHQATGNRAAMARFTITTFRRVTVMAAVGAGVLMAASLAGLVPPGYGHAMLLAGPIVVPLALLHWQRGIAQGLGRIPAAQLPGDVLRPALLAAFLVIAALVPLALTAQGYLVAFAVTAAATLVMALPFTLAGLARVRDFMRSSAEGNTHLWADASPFLGIAVVSMLMGEINTLLLGWLASPREAGLFQPVARLVPLMVIPVQAVEMRFTPRISELWEQGRFDGIARLSRTFTYSTLALTAAVALAIAAAGPWILAAFGAEFSGVTGLLWIIAGAQVLGAACGPASILLIAGGRTQSALSARVVGLFVNFVIGVWLIPRQGALGAAVAMASGIMAWRFTALLLQHRAGGGWQQQSGNS